MIDAFSRCVNLFRPDEVVCMYIDELNPAIIFLVQQFNDTHEGCTCMQLVQQAKSEGDTFRVQTTLSSRGLITKTTSVRQTRALNMTQFRSKSTYDQPISGYEDAEPHPVEHYYAPASVPLSSKLCSTLYRDSEEKGQNNQFLMKST